MSSSPSQPLVSVVVPAYNYAHFIEQTLESLTQQTYERWECVVVDDGSSDETREVVERCALRDSRVRYVWQENAKQAVARNNGIRNATGELFQFLDADDLIEPHKLERQVEYLARHPEVDIVYSGVRYFTSTADGELMQSRQYSVWDNGQPWMPEVSGRGCVLMDRLLRNNIMVVNSPLVRRSVVQAVGEFDVGLTPVEDWDYWTRCAAAGFYFHFEDDEGVRALVRAHSRSESLDGRRMMRSTLRMRRVWADRTLDSAEYLRLNSHLIAECEGLLGVEESLHGKRLRATLQLLKAAALDGRFRQRAKWIACALLAPFMMGERLKGVVTTSITGSMASILRKRQTDTRP